MAVDPIPNLKGTIKQNEKSSKIVHLVKIIRKFSSFQLMTYYKYSFLYSLTLLLRSYWARYLNSSCGSSGSCFYNPGWRRVSCHRPLDRISCLFFSGTRVVLKERCGFGMYFLAILLRSLILFFKD